MRQDELHLRDIVATTAAIPRFLQGTSEETVLADEFQQSAVLQKLIVISEATGRLSEEFYNHHQEIEWQAMIGFRNIAMHEYFAINEGIVWVTAIQDAPLLREQMAPILVDESGDE